LVLDDSISAGGGMLGRKERISWSRSSPGRCSEHIADLEVPGHIYHLGDYDPSGVNAGEKIDRTSREMAVRPEGAKHLWRRMDSCRLVRKLTSGLAG
jgi:hypothetical protein